MIPIAMMIHMVMIMIVADADSNRANVNAYNSGVRSSGHQAKSQNRCD